jgi:hypothetical protein
MNIKVKISKQSVEEFEGNYWNALNDALANSEIEELEHILRECYFIYWYASEVCNGGHGQYFDNRADTDFNEVIAALEKYEANEHSKILRDAIAIQPESFDELSDDEVENLGKQENELDKRFHNADIDLFDLLEHIQKEQEDEIVEWVE